MVYSIDVIENVSGIIWMCFVFAVQTIATVCTTAIDLRNRHSHRLQH